jgi:hypothetical protein
LFALAVVGLGSLWWSGEGMSEEPKGPPPGAPTVEDPRAYEGLPPEQIERLKAGEILILDKPETMEGKQLITAALVFNQDLDTVWSLMTQGWRQEEYLPRLERSPLIKKWDGGDQIEFHVKVLGIAISYRILGTRDKLQYYSHWKLDPDYDNDMKEVSGYWRFYWMDEHHTLARYGTRVETGIGIPAAVQEFLTKRDLPNALGAQKRWIDSGGTWRKEGYQPAP